MNVQETVLPQARRLRVAPELSPEARRRLRWMDYYEAHDRNATQTCRHFDISRETFYRVVAPLRSPAAPEPGR